MTSVLTDVTVVALTAIQHTPGSTKLILVGIALAIPVVTWVALDVIGRRRLIHRR